MKTVIYACDRCGKEQPDTNQLWSIGLICDHGDCNLAYGSSRQPKWQVLWCRKCVDEFSILISLLQPRSVTPTEPILSPSQRLEALIREIVQEELPG